MDVWLALPFCPLEQLAEIVAAADAAGLTGVTLADHVCVPATVDSAYPYSAAGEAEMPVDTAYPDPLVAIAALAARGPNLRFSTYVLLVPLRHPLLLAKAAATAAHAVGGRLDLGVGVGWLKAEFDALGVPFAERGARMDEALPLLRRLWSGEVVAHDGPHVPFGPVAVHPTPPRPIRLLVGGQSPAALRRAARVGDGWTGVQPRVEELVALLGRLEAARAEAGTGDRPFEVRTGVKGRLTPERLAALAQLGVDGVVVNSWQVVHSWPHDARSSATAQVLAGLDELARGAGLDRR